MKSFDENWCAEFKRLVVNDLKSSLNGIISNRNNTSHGVINLITPNSKKNLYVNLKSILDILDNIIKR